MPYRWISRFRQALIGAEELTGRTLAEFDQLDHQTPLEDIELAKSLTKQDVTYLSRQRLREVIRDDLSEEQLAELIGTRRAKLDAIALLLPELIRFLDVTEDRSLAYAVRRVLSTCLDFAVPVPKIRRDKRRNEVQKRLERARKATDQAILAIESIETYVAAEFRGAWDAALVSTGDDGGDRRDWSQLPVRHFETVVAQLKVLAAVIDYQLADLDGHWPSIRLSGPSGKSDVVECIYDLHRVCGGPPIVTTPGSDFSFLCSLLYEMATGQQDESLAGAINRFSRSRDRADQDAHEAEVAADEAAIVSDDNFHGVRSRARRLHSEASRLDTLARASGLSSRAQLALKQQVEVLTRQAVDEEAQVGPFIVWSDQEPRVTREAWQGRHEEMEGRMRELDLRIGTIRRLLRARGIDPNLAEASDFASTPNP